MHARRTSAGFPLTVILTVGSIVAPVFAQCEQATLTASDAAVWRGFGSSVSTKGDLTIVGAIETEGVIGPLGGAYVFRNIADTWSEEANLLPPDARIGDAFGISVATDSRLIVAGSPGDDDACLDDDLFCQSGSVYVFSHDGSGWVQDAKLTASDQTIGLAFGGAVGLDGDFIAVGATGADDACPANVSCNSGAVYVFRFNGSTWTEEARILADDVAEGDQFGSSVAIQGNTLVVGAPRNDEAGAEAGAVYVFRRVDTQWTQEAKLLGDAVAGDLLGGQVAMDSGWVVAGAESADDRGQFSGAVQVFRHGASGWFQEARLTPFDGAASDRFGRSVSLSANLLLVGADGNDDDGDQSGSAYLFRRHPTGWLQEAKLTASDADELDRFGGAVAIYRETAVVGARYYEPNGQPVDAGAAYIFSVPDCAPGVIIPAVSTWGVLVLALGVLAAGQAVLMRRRESSRA